MKREAGWIAGPAVALAAVVGVSSLQPHTPQGTPAPRSVAAASNAGKAGLADDAAAYQGPCHDMADKLRSFLSISAAVRFGPASCGAAEAAPVSTPRRPVAATKPLDPPTHIRFVLATLADPAHTNLPLNFDRNAEAIQQAAHAAGYIYDSSWLPWEAEQPAPPLLHDKDETDSRKEAREDQPGIFLFRKSLRPTDPNSLAKGETYPGDPYRNVLIVFVVAEDATDGLHREQFRNAVEWIKLLRALDGTGLSPVQILGPTFSGSLPSLAEALREEAAIQTLAPPAGDHLQIYSGHVTNTVGAQWFTHSGILPARLGVLFHSFQQDDETVTQRYIGFLKASGIASCHLAIVSEDETAYGGDHSAHSTKTPPTPAEENDCTPLVFSSRDRSVDPAGPTQFFYPRDISALREAYQEQALFNRSPAQGSSDTPRTTLRDDITGSNADNDDTIHSYGGNQTALTEEATLLQIVSMMRSHRSQFILLRSSNSLDQLFLAQFFKVTYPEGRVVILGNDLLLRRDIAAEGLNGVTTIATWPLLPEIDHWTAKFHEGDQDSGNGHLHLAFPESSSQGTFVALSFLLTAPDPDPAKAQHCATAQQNVIFLPFNCAGVDIPDYRYPFWLKKKYPPVPSQNQAQNEAQNQAQSQPLPPDDPSAQTPVTWLSVLGKDGFWPVASLDGGDLEPAPFTLAFAAGALWHAIAHSCQFIFGPAVKPQWRDLPLSMNVCLCAVLLWALFHLICHGAPSITVKPTHRSTFVRMRKLVAGSTAIIHPRTHRMLIVGASSLLSAVATLLAWGYGWLWEDGPIAFHPRFYAAFPIVVWLMGFLAVLTNIWVEHHLRHKQETERKARPTPNWWRTVFPRKTRYFRDVLWHSSVPLTYYVLFTAGFYCFLLLYIDSSLAAQVRVPAYLRSVNLTTGVSPVVPLVLLALGMYGWCWSALQGLSLFGDDRPVLPEPDDLKVEFIETAGDSYQASGRKQTYSFFTMLDESNAAHPIEEICSPFFKRTWAVAVIVFVLILLISYVLTRNVPLRSLGTSRYGLTVCIWLAIIISALLANAWQLAQLWLRLREMLIFLDRMPLRRTIVALRGFSWDSIWKMGGNVLDIRYKIFYRQFEALNHLHANLKKAIPQLTGASQTNAQLCLDAIDGSLPGRRAFSKWYADHWDDWTARDLAYLKNVQKQSAHIAAFVLTRLLVPAWMVEDKSLLILPPLDGDIAEIESRLMRQIVADAPAHLRDAEELVCLLYLGFIQNVLGRMRSLVTGMTCLFLSVALVLPSYPFDPRPLLAGSVITLFLISGCVVFAVYSQMFRDTTLSHLTNTKPGVLGADFWFKFIGFGVGPVFGLLASVFPQFSSFFASWLQPGLSSIK